jgi:CRISPR-associated endoribonuclease Cas6
MFTQASITLLPDDSVRVYPEWAYAMYGILCRELEPLFADVLHQQSLTPVSQFLQCSKVNEPIKWHITLFGSAQEQFIEVLNRVKHYELTKYDTTLKVSDIEILPSIREEEFCKIHLIENELQRRLQVQFVTSTAFKSGGEYVIIPSIELMFQSLLIKWNAFTNDNQLDVSEVLPDICKYTRIVNYSLHSARFEFKGAIIPAFTGRVTLSVRGPETLVRLITLLTEFGRLSGIGIKTALGMGGVI